MIPALTLRHFASGRRYPEPEVRSVPASVGPLCWDNEDEL